MKLFQSSLRLTSSAHAASRALNKWFPTPAFLYPRAAGIDISDASVKWLVFGPEGGVLSWGEEPLAPGIVKGGVILNVDALAAVLRTVRGRLNGIRYAHAALPEEAAYVFGMRVPEGTDYEQALRMIEFEFEGRVPIPPAAAVYDFDVISTHDGAGDEIGVAVFPLDLAQNYSDAFAAAGITLLSLELEARSIARAVSKRSDEGMITLLVDFGRERSGFAVVKHGIPIFTSTVEVGGDAITRALVETMKISQEEAEIFRNEQGLLADGGQKSPGVEAASGAAAALADEIARHYHYWDTRRNERGERMTPVGNVVLVGGSSNLRGLADYISGRVQAPAEVGDIWANAIDYDRYIPPIDLRHSLQYATAAGLALRNLEL